jgi:heme A synthase
MKVVVTTFRGFAVTSAVLAFAIAVLGSWVRINGAGLTCPDWPLCHGEIVPSLHGGVVLEWSHRLVAFLESFVVLGAIVTGFRERKRIAGVTPALLALGVIFAIQVALGGATVILSNSPLSVMLHWGMGMALLATLTALAVLSIVAPADRPLRGSDAAPALFLTAGFAFVTMCLGAYVSSSYAGLACATFPACDGSLLGHGSAQMLQMSHRIAAGAFALVAVFATGLTFASATPRVRAFALAGVALIVVQIGLGAANVIWQLPTAMREAHAANAGATFLAFVVAAVLATLEPERIPTASGARAPSRYMAPNA